MSKFLVQETRKERASKAFGQLRSMGCSMKTAAKAAVGSAVVLGSNAAFALSAADQTKVTDALSNHELLIAAVISGLIGAVLAITGFFMLKKLLGN